VTSAEPGDRIEIIISTTPFYGESGGQVGDRGELRSETAQAAILDTRKPLPDLIVHVAEMRSGTLHTGDAVDLMVDLESRQATALNHTATHLLQAVLVQLLGSHIKQAGSLVTPERLRFDFTHFSPLTAAEIEQVEVEVNRRIRENQAVETEEMAADAAISAGATALFGEKYGDTVRVVRVGDFSMELCGGTHSRAAGDIGLFKIVQETGIAAGVRRIEAVTGARALAVVQRQEKTLDALADLLRSDRQQIETRLQKLLDRQKELEREVESLQDRLQAGQAGDLMDQVREVAGLQLLTARVDKLDGKGQRDLADQLRERLRSGIIIIGGESGGKAALLVAVTKDLTGRLHAGEIIRGLAEQVGGKGGGRPDLAQAGGSRPENIDAALAGAADVVTLALQEK
jgi:alanyl-tRNA synthetase